MKKKKLFFKTKNIKKKKKNLKLKNLINLI